MKLTIEEKNELEELYQFFFNHEKIQEMKKVPMHRGSNTFFHSFKVAKLSIKRALRHKHANLKAILIGAILHDYYLYDWREDKTLLKKHGKNHPVIAASNAKKDFDISSEVEKIIKAHMWPINIKEFPNSREARIVNLADDHVALVEALTSKRYKAKKEKKYFDLVSHLF